MYICMWLFHQRYVFLNLCHILKGKSTLMLFARHPEYRTKWGDRHFETRGYFVSTVGNVNEETVRKYIQEQK